MTTRTPGSTQRRALAGAAMAVLAGLVAAVAAGAGAAATRATAPTSTADKALFAYAKCMRNKGVDIPDPVKGKDGRYAFPTIDTKITGAAGVREKAQACATASGALRGGSDDGNRPDGPGRGFGGPQTAAQKAAFAKFQSCLKAAGVTLPDRGGFGGPPPARTTGTTTSSSSSKAKTRSSGGTVTDPKTGKVIPKPTILGQGPDANDDAAGPGGGRGGFDGANQDPKTRAAFEKCRALLPFGPGGPGGRPGGAPATTTAAK